MERATVSNQRPHNGNASPPLEVSNGGLTNLGSNQFVNSLVSSTGGVWVIVLFPYDIFLCLTRVFFHSSNKLSFHNLIYSSFHLSIYLFSFNLSCLISRFTRSHETSLFFLPFFRLVSFSFISFVACLLFLPSFLIFHSPLNFVSI